jgi:hypothetical protein
MLDKKGQELWLDKLYLLVPGLLLQSRQREAEIVNRDWQMYSQRKAGPMKSLPIPLIEATLIAGLLSAAQTAQTQTPPGATQIESIPLDWIGKVASR